MSKKKPDTTADVHSDEVVPAADKPAANDAQSAGTAMLVRMARDGKTANVHPDELANYAAHGWQPI